MKHTILLVEDEKKIADTLEAGLEEEQFEVSVAYNGLEGKKLYLNNAYDLIILDINLPFMNGYELCKIIREKDKRIPIIMLTALNFMDNKIQGFDVGADDYIVKPFEFRELLARVKALLRRTDVLLDAPEEKTLTIADLEVNLDNKEVKRSGTTVSYTHLDVYKRQESPSLISQQPLRLKTIFFTMGSPHREI